MTKDEAIKSFEEDNRTMLENKTAYINGLKARGMEFEDRMVSYIDESVERNELAISALKGEWIPITYRPATAEELEGTEYTEGNIFTCEMPEDGETVYISIYGETLTDTFRKDDFDSYFEDWGIEHVKAWHKKPEPYKRGE